MDILPILFTWEYARYPKTSLAWVMDADSGREFRDRRRLVGTVGMQWSRLVIRG